MKISRRLILCACSLAVVGQLTGGKPVTASGCPVTDLSEFIANGEHHSVAVLFQNREADETWMEIKSLAQAEAASDSLAFVHPSLTVKIVGSTRQLTLRRGAVGDLGFRDDPYKTPFRKQILIEALRRAIAESHLDDPVQQKSASPEVSGASESRSRKPGAGRGYEQWQCYLDQAEQLVRQTVVAIQSVKNKDDLKQFLQGAEYQIDDLLYNKVFDAIAGYAEANGYNVIYDRGGGVKPFSVSIHSIPEGAKLWLMTDFVYRKQLMTKADPAQWPWQEIVQNPADLIGRYRYRAVWPDGRRAEGSIEVNNASPLKFLPQ